MDVKTGVILVETRESSISHLPFYKKHALGSFRNKPPSEHTNSGNRSLFSRTKGPPYVLSGNLIPFFCNIEVKDNSMIK